MRARRQKDGQATVEAALLLPMLLFFFAFLLQPACLLYARSVMEAAAGEGARALATAYGDAATADTVREFVLRRLDAVPNLEIFHIGGHDGWKVELEGAGELTVRVSVVGHARPLPFFGGLTQVVGETDGEGIVLRVVVEEAVRPAWLDGGYDDWIGVWG